MADLKHRRIVITGAARGIGREIATACASRGAALALFDREEPELTALAARITAGGGTVAAHTADVRDYEAMERGVERAAEVLGGPLDGVVLNAGIAPPARLRDGDRVELYRPLELDPREARRQLASAGLTMDAVRKT